MESLMRTNWKDIAELIGIVAIVLTLAFVGYQLQQDRDIAVAQLMTDAEIKQIELSNLISSYSSLWARGLQGEQLTTEEEVIFESIVHAVSVKYGSMMERADRRLLSKSGRVSRQFALHVYANPGLRRVWQARCEYFEIVSGSIDSGCERINLELKKIEDGTLPPLASKLWSL
jgi:hypothetical protein